MCRQGVGIAFLPHAVGNQIPDLRELDTPSAPPSREIWMGYHRDLKHLQRLPAFIDVMDNHLREVLP